MICTNTSSLVVLGQSFDLRLQPLMGTLVLRMPCGVQAMALELARCRSGAVANAPTIGAVCVLARADNLNLVLALFAAHSVALILAKHALVLVKVSDVIVAALVTA